MKLLKDFIIPFVGLKEGKHEFTYQIENTFFEHFEYDDFNNVALKGTLVFDKKSTFFELFFHVEGIVNVNCDLTTEPFDLTINDDFKLLVKFGYEYNDDNEEILIIPQGDYEINVAQYFYELVILALPAKRIHPGIEDGTLQSDMLDKLQELSPKGLEEKEETSEEIDPRWNTLKRLLTDK
ncbi:MAG: DNA-binding protein [Bacteroidetes bacterium MedPE-SWsnd-G2]|nr:MAG: DNA-binding protein [Bacteroidetes bacterium MedPE-SWsnd-G2]